MDQRARLYYLRDSSLLKVQKSYMKGPNFIKTIPLCNYRLQAGPELLNKDVRGMGDTFSLATSGFVFRPWAPSTIDWESEHQIVHTYLPEAKDLIHQELDLGDAFKGCEVFEWRVR